MSYINCLRWNYKNSNSIIGEILDLSFSFCGYQSYIPCISKDFTHANGSFLPVQSWTEGLSQCLWTGRSNQIPTFRTFQSLFYSGYKILNPNANNCIETQTSDPGNDPNSYRSYSFQSLVQHPWATDLNDNPVFIHSSYVNWLNFLT